MTPSRIYPEWNKRQTDKAEQRDPYRKYFFICEGSNTEIWYIKSLIDCKKQLRIKPIIDLRLLEKTDEDRTNSNPKKLIEFAQKEKQNKKNQFSKGYDKTIIVFDLDVFRNYDEFYRVKESSEKDDILAVSNPCFELFLLLHFENAYDLYISPNYDEILRNRKINKHTRYLTRLVSQVSKMNPKKNEKIGLLAKNVTIAIGEEKNINESIEDCQEQLTCNLGSIIATLIDEGKEE